MTRAEEAPITEHETAEQDEQHQPGSDDTDLDPEDSARVSGEDLIDESGQNLTQRRIDEEV